MTLIKRVNIRQIPEIQPVIICPSFNRIVVNTDSFVRVTYGYVEMKIVTECVVVVVIELG